MLRPLRYPIISRDLIFATRNSKLAFHLRELQFASLYSPSPRLTLHPFHVSFHFSPNVVRFLLVLRLLSNLTSLSFHSQSYHLYYVSPHLRNPRAIFPSPAIANQPTLSLSLSFLFYKNQIHRRGEKVVQYSFKINLFQDFSIGARISTRD